MTGRARRPVPLLALLCLPFLACPRPSAADYVVEQRFKVNLMFLGSVEGRMVCSLRNDRARIESWSGRGGTSPGDGAGAAEEPHLILVRCDLGVSWVTEYGNETYTEAPWPDTLTCPPPPAGGDATPLPADVIGSLDWICQVTPTGDRDSIAGFAAERVVVRATGHAGARAKAALAVQLAEMRQMDPSFDEKSVPDSIQGMILVHELWLARDLPAELDSLWSRWLLRTIRSDGSSCFPGTNFADSIDRVISRLPGTCLRYRSFLELAAAAEEMRRMGAQLRDSSNAWAQNLGGMVDLERGEISMGSYEVVSIREEAVPDQRYELPAGLRRVRRTTPWDYPGPAPDDR